MAKKRKKKAAGVLDTNMIENGVEVSRWGTDQGYLGLGAGAVDARDSIVLKEMQLAANGKRTTNAYRKDHIDRLQEERAIDTRQADCGRYFRNDVRLALSSGFPQRALEVISGGAGDKDVIKNWKAYRKVRGAIKAMGGNCSKHTQAAWDYIILEQALLVGAEGSGHARDRNRLYLIEALGKIADYYYPIKKSC